MKFTIILTWLFVFSFSAFSQQFENIWKVEEGWKELLPFHSTKADVEKIFGKGIQSKDQLFYQYKYNTEDAVISVDYAGKPCDGYSHSPDHYDIRENTILRYKVRLKSLMPISEFKFNKNRFERGAVRSQNGLLLPYFSYHQLKEDLWKVPNEWSAGTGIEFWGDIIQSIEYVEGFRFGPSYDDLEKYRCNKTDSQQHSVKIY